MNLFWSKQLIVWYFIQACIKERVFPLRYFSLNLEHIDPLTGLYSKYTLNEKIPSQWKLNTILLSPEQSLKTKLKTINDTFEYPLFLKPEWSHRSFGVYRVKNKNSLKRILKKIQSQNISYLCQEAATGAYEYDLFSIVENDTKQQVLFSCTKSLSPAIVGDGEKNIRQLVETQLPSLEEDVLWISTTPEEDVLAPGKKLQVSFINGTKNGTTYRDETDQFSTRDIQKVFKYIQTIGQFSMNRISVSADSVQDIVAGNFTVIEMNLFTPFPLNLLDRNISRRTRKQHLKDFAFALARSIKSKPKSQEKTLSTLLNLYKEISKQKRRYS